MARVRKPDEAVDLIMLAVVAGLRDAIWLKKQGLGEDKGSVFFAYASYYYIVSHMYNQ